MQKLDIMAQPMVTPKGKKLDGEELVVQCPMWLCKSNVRRTCAKCMAKQEINYKEKYVMCNYQKK